MITTSHPSSHLLILGSNSIQALLPAALSVQVESLLDDHKLPEAVALADKQRQKLQTQRNVTENERSELCYVYQCIGFQYFRDTMFEDAGKTLFLGQLNPCILISYFPELRGALFDAEGEAEVFSGVAKYMPTEASVDDIIAINLVRNYSPHLSPNTREAPVTVELRQALRYMAEEMLERFLRNCRFQMRTGTKGKGRATLVTTAVDTVLAKVYAKSLKSSELETLVSEASDLVLSEVEPFFLAAEQYSTLCRLYEREGETEKLLDAWASIADGKWAQHDVANTTVDPVSAMETLLLARKDRNLSARWGVWLAHRDPERGLRLLLSRDTGKRNNKVQSEEDRLVLESLQQQSPAAASMYLEHLVLHRKSLDSNLHTKLATSYIDTLSSFLVDEVTSKLWRAKFSSYTANPSPMSFLSYFASTTPESESKRARLKAVLFLQGSMLYDTPQVLSQLSDGLQGEDTKLLSLELAILEGKLMHHDRALSLLVHNLNDATSAETYCTLGGEVVPARTALTLGETYALQPWAATLTATSGPGTLKRQKTVDDGLKRSLIAILLKVYMDGGEANAARTAHLLNAQAMNLDVIDVITSIPDEWPVASMSSFLTRSFRRTMHDKHEQQIKKNISMSQNLRVSEETWLVIREQGAVVEEADSGSDGEGDELEEKVILEKFDDLSVAAITPEDESAGEQWYPDTMPL